MKGELWLIQNGYTPDDEKLLRLAEIQLAIQEHLNEVYSLDIGFPHFLERKENFHDAIRKTIREVVKKE